MKPILSVEETTRLEDLIEKRGTSRAQLMELAGEYAASVVEGYKPKRAVVLAGFGNNGGDGWVAADVLQQKGITVDVITPLEPNEIESPLARHVARRTAGRDVNVVVGPSRDELTEYLSKADVVLDALLGTGFTGDVRPPFSIWIPVLNELDCTVVSVDVPSGLDATTGYASDICVRATSTATMLAPKIGLYSADGPEVAGVLECGKLYDNLDDVIVDVEHEAEIVESIDLVSCLRTLPENVNKYSRGSVLVVGGSSTYPGAAIMAAQAALRAGAGYVTVAAPDACANLIRMALPCVPVVGLPSDARGAFGTTASAEVLELAKQFDCVLCGPGMTTAAGCTQIVTDLAEQNIPLILDADALNCISRLAIDGIDTVPELFRRDAPLIFTPHYQELARLVGKDDIEDISTAIDAAQRIVWSIGSDDMVVVAKGPRTAVVGVDKVLLPQPGPASLATAGSGDVFAGIIAASIATSHGEAASWELASAYSVAVHSAAGFIAACDKGPYSVIATDLIDCLGDALEQIEVEALTGSDVDIDVEL